jgi:imidazolonepropionase
LITGARQLLTLAAKPGVRRGSAMKDLGVIENGAVLIRNSEIVQVGLSRRLENLREAKNAIKIDAGGRVVLPALVDPSLFAVAGDSAERRREFTAAKALQALLSTVRVVARYGTARTELKVGGRTPSEDMRLLRQSKHFDPKGAHVVRTWFAGARKPADEKEFADSCLEHIEYVKKRRLASFFELEVRNRQTALAAEVFAAASAAGLGCKISWRDFGDATLASLLSVCKIRTVRCVCGADNETAQAIARSPTILIAIPTERLFEPKVERLNLRGFLDAGGGIAIGTGYDPHRLPVFNMQVPISLAVLQCDLSPEEAITAATINAAYASGLGSQTGSLEVGKSADVLILNVNDYRELPLKLGVNNAAAMIRSGNVLFKQI